MHFYQQAMSLSSKQAELHAVQHSEPLAPKKKNTDSKQDRAVLLTIRKPSKSIILITFFFSVGGFY